LPPHDVSIFSNALFLRRHPKTMWTVLVDMAAGAHVAIIAA
jgi:hypothetical protein